MFVGDIVSLSVSESGLGWGGDKDRAADLDPTPGLGVFVGDIVRLSVSGSELGWGGDKDRTADLDWAIESWVPGRLDWGFAAVTEVFLVLLVPFWTVCCGGLLESGYLICSVEMAPRTRR